MGSINLAQKSCVPCSGVIPAMSPREIEDFLKQLSGQWALNKSGHLYKKFTYPNFIAAMDFANKITLIAEKEQHHPVLLISWGSCLVEIWTHAINGLTESDFILAAKIQQIYAK